MRLIVALGAAVTLSLPVIGWAEPEAPEPPAAVPIVTLEALPLEIPTGRLPEPARVRAERVLAGSIFSHRVTGIRHRSREAVFRFLLDHPDFAASVVRALKLKGYRVIPLDDGYWADDDRGATGIIRVLHADDLRRLFHVEGRYVHRFHPTVEGQILLLLEFQHEEDGTGGTVVEATLTGYIMLDSPLVGALAQVVAALTRPLVERAVERKVHGFFTTVARLSRWAYDEPEQVVAALDGHPEVVQGSTLTAFQRILLAGRPPAWARAPFHLFPDGSPAPEAGAERLSVDP